MGVWAGPLHELVELRSLRRVRESVSDPVTYTTGLSGRRRARFTPTAPRDWSCQVSAADPAGLATLHEFYWAHRARPVWLVTEAAAVQNVLPPPVTVYDRAADTLVPVGWDGDVVAGGRVVTADGVAAASFLVDPAGPAASPVVPVLERSPVTASAYVPAGATVELRWVDATGGETSAGVSAAAPVDGARVAVSVEAAPGGACRLVVDGAAWYARPQVTWTAGPVPYVTGKGAPSVLFGPVAEDVLLAAADGSRNLSAYSYTITEVG